MMTYLPLFIVFWPLFVAGICLLLKQQFGHRLLYLLSTILSLLAVLAIFWLENLDNFHTIYQFSWFPYFNSYFALGLDYFTASFLVLSAVVFLGLGIMRPKLMGFDLCSFYPWFLIMQSCLAGIFMSTDLVLFYIFWELVMLPVLVLLYRQQRAAEANYVFIYTLAGSFMLFAAIIFWFVRLQSDPNLDFSTSFFVVQESLKSKGVIALSSLQLTISWILVGLAMAVKAPLFLFHGWQPLVYRRSPTGLTIILAAILSKMAIYGLIRIGWGLLGSPPELLQSIILFITVIGVLYAALAAWGSSKLKNILIYSSLSHLNLMLFGIFIGDNLSLLGATYLAVQHGFIIMALFLISALIEQHSTSQQEISGLFKLNPLLGGFFLFFSLANIGMPGLSGFVGEFTILLGAFYQHKFLTGLVAVIVVFSAIYQLTAIKSICFGSTKNVEGNPRLNLAELLFFIILGLIIIIAGIMPNYIFNIINIAP